MHQQWSTWNATYSSLSRFLLDPGEIERKNMTWSRQHQEILRRVTSNKMTTHRHWRVQGVYFFLVRSVLEAIDFWYWIWKCAAPLNGANFTNWKAHWNANSKQREKQSEKQNEQQLDKRIPSNLEIGWKSSLKNNLESKLKRNSESNRESKFNATAIRRANSKQIEK